MKHIVFDIETVPQDEAKLLALAPEFTPASNLKDPEKIAASIAKKRADYLADAALNWKTAEVVLIGAGDESLRLLRGLGERPAAADERSGDP